MIIIYGPVRLHPEICFSFLTVNPNSDQERMESYCLAPDASREAVPGHGLEFVKYGPNATLEHMAFCE